MEVNRTSQDNLGIWKKIKILIIKQRPVLYIIKTTSSLPQKIQLTVLIFHSFLNEEVLTI